jgi:two-component system cell cycle sensor histidine kinase PleC
MIQNKHIIRLSFIGLFLNIVANIVLYRYFIIEEVVIKRVSDQNTRIAEAYKEKIWDNNKNAILKLNTQNFDSLLNDQEFIQFISESSGFFSEIKDSVSLYDKNSNKFIESKPDDFLSIKYNFSAYLYKRFILTLDKYFLSSYFSDNPLMESIKGKASHSLVSRALITDKNHNLYESSFIISYIPIISNENGDYRIDGIIKITTDITDQWDNITYLEKRIFLSFFIVFIVFFIIIMYNTNYAQRIINKQFETNRELEEAKIKAETESSAKTQFLANVSHELRTPLNAIIGFSEIILSETHGKLDNIQYKDYINDINNSGKHLLSVINDILDFSKASVDKLKVETIDLDLNKLAAASMRFVKPRADKANIRLIEDFPEEHVVIKADAKRLKQVFLNLLSNSVKFTPSDGAVTLSIKKDAFKKLVYISVTDTGIGMSEEDIPKAISSFGQIDSKLSRKYEGTGLGLPLTKKLVELMNGTFDIKSTVGKGTTITITFQYSEVVSI